MKQLFTFILLACSCWAQTTVSGGTTGGNIYPANTGQLLGKSGQRWDAFIQNLDVSNSVTIAGATTFTGGAATTSAGNFIDAATDSYFQSLIGGITNAEFHTIQTTGYSTDAIFGGVAVPASSTKLQGGNGVTGVITNASTVSNAVGGYFTGRALANGTHIWGINPLVQIDTFTGVDAQAIEADVNINTTNVTTANGITLTGDFAAQPSANANAVMVATPAHWNGASWDYRKWNFGLVVSPAATDTAAVTIGPSVRSGTGNSQILLWQSLNTDVTKNVYEASSSNGDWQVQPEGGKVYFLLANAGGVSLPGSTSGNTIIVAPAVASGTLTLPAATDTLIGKATSDVLTNKIFDTAGAGNVLKINGVQISDKTGTGKAVLDTSPTITTPTLTGVTNGTGLQMLNSSTTCTTGAGVGDTCTTAAINLPVGYADTNYRLSCTGLTPTNVPIVQTVAKSNTSFTITVAALTAAAASFASFDCISVHN